MRANRPGDAFALPAPPPCAPILDFVFLFLFLPSRNAPLFASGTRGVFPRQKAHVRNFRTENIEDKKKKKKKRREKNSFEKTKKKRGKIGFETKNIFRD